MSEENTGRVNDGRSFESRMLEQFTLLRQSLNSLGDRLSGVEVRLSALEEKVDARLRETRPIWEAVLSRLDSVDARLAKMDAKFDVVGSQLLDMRGDIEMLKKRPPAA
jgi:hypothetical protein